MPMEKPDRIECPDCGATFELSDEKGELTCECGAILISEEQEQAELLLSEELSRKWYYSRDKQRYGPVPWNRIKKFVSGGKLGPDDLIWSRGMERWRRVRSFKELIASFPEEDRPELLEEESPGGVPDVRSSGGGLPGGNPETFFIRVSAGLLASLSFFLFIGVAVVLYGAFRRELAPAHATWLSAAFIAGAVLSAGASQMLRLFCDGLQNVLEIKSITERSCDAEDKKE